MKNWPLILFLMTLILSCSSEEKKQEVTEDEPLPHYISDEFTVDDETFEVEDIEARKFQLAGHPWLEVSFNVIGYNEDDTTIVKIDVTAESGKHWIDPPLGDTTGAIVTLINRNDHVQDYYRPLKKDGKTEGWVEVNFISDETIDFEFNATIENGISSDSIPDRITLKGNFTDLLYVETNILGIPIDNGTYQE